MISAVDGIETLGFNKSRDGENGDNVNKECEGNFFEHIDGFFQELNDMVTNEQSVKPAKTFAS